MDGEKLLEHRTVVVRDGRIVTIAPAAELAVPEDAAVISGEGRYLMPGLGDMHIHMLAGNPYWENDLFLYVANGVTMVREMWGNAAFLRYRDLERAGQIVAPRMILASTGMDGPPGRFGALTPYVTSQSEARRLVAQYRRDGYDFIKVYTDLARDVWEAVLDEAPRQGIRVVGHVPSRAGLDAVLASGQYSIEHCMGMAEATVPAGGVFGGAVDESLMDALAARVCDSGTWNVPTIAVKLNSQARIPELEARPEMRYISPAMRQWFLDPRTAGTASDTTRYEANLKAVLRCLDRAGARLMLGVDSGFRYALPGFSVHDELRYTVESGLAPYRALRMATVEAARFLDRQDELGVVVEGKIADLLLLEANPFDDVANAGRRFGVMLGGRWIEQAWLSERLGQIARMYGN
jgi:imidazolonepropionase-like amidohydrolase